MSRCRGPPRAFPRPLPRLPQPHKESWGCPISDLPRGPSLGYRYHRVVPDTSRPGPVPILSKPISSLPDSPPPPSRPGRRVFREPRPSNPPAPERFRSRTPAATEKRAEDPASTSAAPIPQVYIELGGVPCRGAHAELERAALHHVGRSAGGYLQLHAGRARDGKGRTNVKGIAAVVAGCHRTDPGVDRTGLRLQILLDHQQDRSVGHGCTAVRNDAPDCDGDRRTGRDGEKAAFDATGRQEQDNPDRRSFHRLNPQAG